MFKKYIIFITLTLFLFTSTASANAANSDQASYMYDALGRITKITFNNGTTVVYSYDNNGNRTTVVVTCSSSGC